MDPYTTAVSDTYQDLFSEGIFTGKGLYDVDAFVAALEGRVPENALLSHDLFEGLHARPALVTDVEVVDDYPASVLDACPAPAPLGPRRLADPLLALPAGADAPGPRAQPLPLISRWKIFDNLRRTLVAPGTLLALVAGWLVLPGRPWVWTAAIVGALAFPVYPHLLRLLVGRDPQQPLRVFLRIVREDVQTAGAQVLLLLTFLAYHAYEMVHAIALTLMRLLFTQRRLLEWETAAAAAARAAGLSARSDILLFIGEMASSPLIALMVLVIVVGARPAALPVAAPILALWLAAPVIAAWLSRPVQPPRQRLDDEDRLLLRVVARKTWRYFEAFMGAADHGLPPDNFQEVPVPTVAHRTSPTNIAMGLLSTLAAHDLGYITTGELLEKLETLMTTMEALERHEGHFLNWYDTTHPGTADATLRIHGRQRQPRGRAHRHGRWAAAPGNESADRRGDLQWPARHRRGGTAGDGWPLAGARRVTVRPRAPCRRADGAAEHAFSPQTIPVPGSSAPGCCFPNCRRPSTSSRPMSRRSLIASRWPIGPDRWPGALPTPPRPRCRHAARGAGAPRPGLRR